MTNEVKNVPKLRFPEFEGEWEEKPLKDIVDVRSGKDYKHLNKGYYPVYGTGGYMVSVDEYLYDGDAIGIGRKGTINKPYLLKGPFWTVDTLFYCVPKKNNTYFILSLFKNINWKIYDESTGVPSLSKVTINKIQRKVPANEEQKKIGDFFSKLDRQIELEEQKLEKLEEQKKGYMQKIFSQKIRFKDENGNNYPVWQENKLENIALKVKTKNFNNEYKETFTNSAEFGIVSQRDFFDKDISNEKNLTNYYIVEENDFVYNPRISNYAPVGPINRNKLGRTGIMSPLYTVFKVENINKLFLEYYFKTSQWHKFMKLNGDSGARSDRFTIKINIFMQMPIMMPAFEEQEKIGNFFSKIDNFIEKQSDKVELLKERKKGFLQKMFV